VVGTGYALSHCHENLSTGTQTYRLETAEGRLIGFSGPPGTITAKADINDRVSQQTNPSSGAVEWVLLRGDDSTEIYSSQGRLLRKTSLTGRDAVTYTYSAGRLVSMTDRVGRTLTFGYDAKGRISTMTDPAGGLFQYGYEDAWNLLTSVTYPDGMVRTYHYNEPANINNGVACSSTTAWALTGISDNGQRLSTYKYDCSRRAVSTELAGGVNKYSYTWPGGAVEVDPLGTTRTLYFGEWQSVLKPYQTSQPAASGTGTVMENMSYNANGSLSQRQDFNGNKSTYTYDLARNLETQRKEALTVAGANTPQTRTINTQWHPSFRLPTKVAEPLRITT
jgi:YD repeat-containing protein